MGDELGFFTGLQTEMDSYAGQVWSMVKYSRDQGYRLSLGETTLTDLGFYHLRKYYTKTVYIRTEQPNETRTGADWEWLIGHGNEWVQIRAQAKVIDKRGSFRQLGHAVKSVQSSRPVMQIDTLISPPSDSVVQHWMPLYVFYASTPPAKTPALALDEGCSARLAHFTRDTLRSNARTLTLTSRKHLQGVIAWSQIFSGLVERLNAGETLDAIISSLATSSFHLGAHTTIHDFWRAGSSSSTAATHAQSHPTKGNSAPPEYISRILDSTKDDFHEARAAILNVNYESRPEQPVSTDELGYQTFQESVPSVGPIKPSTPSWGELSPLHPPLPTRSLDLPTPPDMSNPLPKVVAMLDIDRLPSLPER